MSITPAQCRAARAWLQWSQGKLSAEAGVSVPAIARFERDHTDMSSLGQRAIIAAFLDAGVDPRVWWSSRTWISLTEEGESIAAAIERCVGPEGR